MKYLFPLALLLISSTTLFAQESPLEKLIFEVTDPLGGTGSAQLTGTIDEVTNRLRIIIDYKGLERPLLRAYMHLGTASKPGKNIVNLSPMDDELSTAGQIDRTIIGSDVSFNTSNTKTQAKAQDDIFTSVATFNLIVQNIKTDNLCINLQFSDRNGSFTTALASPVRLDASAAVPTMSQWSVFILGLLFSCTAVIYLSQKDRSII